MKYYRNSLIKIQRWTRSMKDRLNYILFRRVVISIQINYRNKFDRRNLAALKIQRFYFEYKCRMFENNQKLRLNYAAKLIQSLWRGYVVRKE